MMLPELSIKAYDVFMGMSLQALKGWSFTNLAELATSIRESYADPASMQAPEISDIESGIAQLRAIGYVDGDPAKVWLSCPGIEAYEAGGGTQSILPARAFGFPIAGVQRVEINNDRGSFTQCLTIKGIRYRDIAREAKFIADYKADGWTILKSETLDDDVTRELIYFVR